MEGGNRAAWAMVQILRGEERRFWMGREGGEIIHRLIGGHVRMEMVVSKGEMNGH
jgi:hypothetical protein